MGPICTRESADKTFLGGTLALIRQKTFPSTEKAPQLFIGLRKKKNPHASIQTRKTKNLPKNTDSSALCKHSFEANAKNSWKLDKAAFAVSSRMLVKKKKSGKSNWGKKIFGGLQKDYGFTSNEPVCLSRSQSAGGPTVLIRLIPCRVPWLPSGCETGFCVGLIDRARQIRELPRFGSIAHVVHCSSARNFCAKSRSLSYFVPSQK